MEKQYIGDGVYAAYDGFGIVLTTENGYEITNTIVLEPEVYEGLLGYVAALKKSLAAQSDSPTAAMSREESAR